MSAKKSGSNALHPKMPAPSSALPSALLRLVSTASLASPHLLPLSSLPVAGVLAPILYLLALPEYLRELRRKPIVEEREITQIISSGGKKRRAIEKRAGVQVMKVKKDLYVRREGEVSIVSTSSGLKV
jgi:L-fucose mutarotase/ribose pyranase (RbsD/FucU family)